MTEQKEDVLFRMLAIITRAMSKFDEQCHGKYGNSILGRYLIEQAADELTDEVFKMLQEKANLQRYYPSKNVGVIT